VNPVEPTDAQAAFWTERDGAEQVAKTIGGPHEGPDVIPCPALVAPIVVERDDGVPVRGVIFHVAYQLDEIEVAALAQGATLWMSTWGGLPIHHLEVVPKDAGR
jgi:hypothetical protein